MHRLKHASKETGKGRAPEHKPDWVEALEHNDMVKLGELAKNDFHPSIFEGHVTSLEINGKVSWMCRCATCLFDCPRSFSGRLLDLRVCWTMGAQ
jgi:hypothetical protein